MKRPLITGMIAAALAAGAVSIAVAQSDRAIERSGKTFHVRVCKANGNKDEARCHAHVVTDSNGVPIVAASPFALPSGYGPLQLRTAYNTLGYPGSGMTIAVVDAFGYSDAEADLAKYRAQYGLPPCTTANGCFSKVNQTGQARNYPRDDNGWAQETALDLDMVSAICPNCKILLVEATSNSFVNLGTAVNTAASFNPVAISNSYGAPEAGTSPYESYYNHPGIAVTVSSGDAGYGVEFPAASRYAVAVGGTSLNVASGAPRGYTEAAWAGAGSGCSSLFTKPSWQTDAGCTRRTVADVSAVADPNTGVAVYGPTSRNKSGWMVFGGTSASAPLIAGMFGLTGPGSKSVQTLYAFQNNLFDVVTGSNGNCGGSYLCAAKVGFDGPTGLGTPNSAGAF